MRRTSMAWAVGAMVAGTVAWGQHPAARITAHVVDETGAPVPQAVVRLAFETPDAPSGEIVVVGATDTNGMVSGEARCDGMVFVRVEKQDYYYSLARVPLRGGDGRWEPWGNVQDVELKRVVDPVPMYARHVEAIFPKGGNGFGFDLAAGDWVTPYGRGLKNDLVFTLERRFADWNDFDVSVGLIFMRAGDGIQGFRASPREGSYFRSPRTAPEEGYQARWSRTFGSDPASGYTNITIREDQNYIFRVRSETNELGEVTNAWYGKMYGEIGVVGYGTDASTITFTYYANPDGTRNLEFDPESNLAPGLKPVEQVVEP